MNFNLKKILFISKIYLIINIFSNSILHLIYLCQYAKWRNQNLSKHIVNPINYNYKYAERFVLYEHINQSFINNDTISYVEFGVAHGETILWWANNNNNVNTELWGFDTFTGLPEAWGNWESGHFDNDGNFPKTDDSRCHFIKGLFQETVHLTIPKIDFSKRCVFHMDADLYSSTIYVLYNLYPYMKPNDIIIFDEFSDPLHEFKAFSEFVQTCNIKYEVLAGVNNFNQIAIKLL